ncbi:[NiFe] hydrogenase metallocenter assembly protein HypF [hydrothermal vent metagenome]|uniref:Carbamoyl phosphate-converting enzyme HypF n=1 Tax=hydrothermal vent metagenome TaxID=652676 RepID=A0A3B1DJT4_9ZZZZ
MKAKAALKSCDLKRLEVSIYGAVQGVGFRPFIYQLAKKFNLKGKVYNTASGLMIEAEGSQQDLDVFLSQIPAEKPPHSYIEGLQYVYLDPCGFSDFQITKSDATLPKKTYVQPDLATCPECIKEIFDSKNRRYLYPFTNCTHCGPRFSIVKALPYDRVNTSMANFTMCADCQEEYDNPDDRRFHAQPNACPQCGPHVELWDKKGNIVQKNYEAIKEVAAKINEGKIVAVKGIGGFHLFVDAGNEEAVAKLRQRKHREEKPFAVMFLNLSLVEKYCIVSQKERLLLVSVESPIVLLKKDSAKSEPLAENISFHNPYLGCIFAYSPLHHILMKELKIPVVATSGNLSDEPICTDEKEALDRLCDIADCFLVHDRPIERSIDDSVVRIMMDRPQVIRRSRGYAPMPISINNKGQTILGVGAHLKNTMALNIDNNVFISQHIGDLQTSESLRCFEKTRDALQQLYHADISKIACDLHPDYLSTKMAKEAGLPMVEVQHHHAHIVSCMAENQIQGEVLGIVWDGTGFGEDGTIWGGEFLSSTLSDFTHLATFKTFPLIGGDKALKEPRRVAWAILRELGITEKNQVSALPTFKAFREDELVVVTQMLEKEINAPRTSSVGRLFDAVASLLGLKQVLQFEGQAAMQLEYLCEGEISDERYSFTINEDKEIREIDWQQMFKGIIGDLRQNRANNIIAIKFHNTLVEMAIDVVKISGYQKVVLSGGCFQNKYLTEKLISRLTEENFQPYWHQCVPPNDGGISLGQVTVALNRI